MTHFQYISSARLPTRLGEFKIHGFLDSRFDQEHIALTYGEWQPEDTIQIRIHSECLTGDSLFSTRCDCGFQLEKAMDNIVKQGRGVILYLRQEGRGIGLLNKIKAYHLQDNGMDTVEANEHLGFDADLREYSICQFMLKTLSVNHVALMSNNPKKLRALRSLGVDVISRHPIDHGVTEDNVNYLRTKTQKLGHQFDLEKLR